jgi:hypothetical protein
MRGAPALTSALLAALLVASPGRAEDLAPAHVGYAVYAAGMNVLDITSEVDVAGPRYRLDFSSRTAGLFGAFFNSQSDSFVQGAWMGTRPAPLRFASWGTLRGTARRTTLDYEFGQPVVRTLEPPDEPDHDAVPLALQRDTVDALSALAMLVRQVALTNRCDGHLTIFDGRRVSEITARTVGEEALAPTSRSTFAGPALRCDFAGRQLAGFKHDESETDRNKVHESTAWFARVVPGAPPLPVRVRFESRFFSQATAYLVEAGPGHPGLTTIGATR